MEKPGITGFEDLIAWQKSKRLSLAVYEITSADKFYRDFSIRDQIRRASVSVMSNIAEGFGRYGAREFRHYLSIANGSAYEVRSQIILASELGYITEQEADILVEMCKEVSRLIEGLRRSSKKSPE